MLNFGSLPFCCRCIDESLVCRSLRPSLWRRSRRRATRTSSTCCSTQRSPPFRYAHLSPVSQAMHLAFSAEPPLRLFAASVTAATAHSCWSCAAAPDGGTEIGLFPLQARLDLAQQLGTGVAIWEVGATVLQCSGCASSPTAHGRLPALCLCFAAVSKRHVPGCISMHTPHGRLRKVLTTSTTSFDAHAAASNKSKRGLKAVPICVARVGFACC